MPAHLQFENGGESVALIPTRYPGSETAERRVDRAGAEDRVGGDRAGHAPRSRSAHHRHGCRRDARSWRSARSRSPATWRRRRIARTNMAEQLLPQDRLQPALLDRLTDEEPDKTQEPLRRASCRRAACASRSCAISPGCSTPRGSTRSSILSKLQAVRRSVVNFGLPALSGHTASSLDMTDLARAVREAILMFEPRILPATLQIRTTGRRAVSSITTTSSVSRFMASSGRSPCPSSSWSAPSSTWKPGRCRSRISSPSRVA